MTDDLTDVIETLRTKRAAHMDSIKLLDEAIATLQRLAGAESPAQNGAVVIEPGPVSTPYPGSVLEAAIALAAEAERDWAADEILDEYVSRGTPIGVKDPMNAMFSALSRASKKGLLVRTTHGRYVHPKFAADWGETWSLEQGPPDDAADEEEPF